MAAVDRFTWARDDVDVALPDQHAGVAPRWALVAAAGDQTDGAMIALVPAEDDLRNPLALDPDVVPGAEPASQLHLTLAYLGNAADWSPDQREVVLDAMQGLADQLPAGDGHVFGAAHWNTDGPEASWVLNVGGVGLELVHGHVWEVLGNDDADLPELPEQHAPRVPQICLAYSPTPTIVGVVEARVGRDLVFDRLRVAFGDQVTDLKLQPPAGDTASGWERLHPGHSPQKVHGGSNGGGGSLAGQLEAAGLDADTAARMDKVHSAFRDRYGIMLTSVEASDERGLVAEIKRDKLIVNPANINDAKLAAAEERGWAAPGTGSVEGLMTHEMGHVVLHSGVLPRDPIVQANRIGRRLGGGADISRMALRGQVEREAEQFASYHRGGAGRPDWLLAWGEELHKGWGMSTAPLSFAATGRVPARKIPAGFRSPGYRLPPDDEDLAASVEVLHPGHGSQKVHGRRRGADGAGPKRYTRGAGTKDDPVVTNDAWAAAEALGEGKHVQLESPEEVGTLLDRLHVIGVEAEAAGTKAKLYDLCKVSVARTNLFCAESKGVARIDMPQFRGRPRVGSPADSMDKLKDGKVDLSRPFIADLQSSGIRVSGDTVDASHLKATQRELDGVKVAGMMTAMQDGRLRVRDAFFVSKDNYVVDGHHLWAATVGREFKEGRTLNLDVQRIDAPILDVLDRANTFTADQGLPRAGIAARLVDLLAERGITVAVDADTALRIFAAAARGDAKADLDLDDDGAALYDEIAEVFHPGHSPQKVHGHPGPGEHRRPTNPPRPSKPKRPSSPPRSSEWRRPTNPPRSSVPRRPRFADDPQDGHDKPDPEPEPFHLAGKHDQKRHAGKQIGGAGRAGMGDVPLDEGTLKDFHGGSAMGHLVTQADGTVTFSPERQALHDEIINRHLAGKTPVDEPVYNVLGGGTASGKSTMVNSPAGEKLRDRNTVMVNADDMKAELPEYQQMLAAGDTRAASFTHEESSYLAKRLQAASFENRFNVTLDGTGDSAPAKLRGKMDAARAAGYSVHGHYVTVPADVAVTRSNARAAATGRFVPEPVIRSNHAAVSRTLPEVVQDFDQVDLFDTRGSTLEHVMEWRNGTFTVHDAGLWDEFVAKGAA